METKIIPSGEDWPIEKRISSRVQSYFEDVWWFIKYISKESYLEIKRIIMSIRTYKILFIILGFYFYLFTDRKSNVLLIWLGILLAVLLEYWQNGNWKDYKRKTQRKEYFSSEHPEKVKEERK